MGEIKIVGPGKTRGYPYPACKNSLSLHATRAPVAEWAKFWLAYLAELQIRRGIENNSKIFFLISQ